MLKPPTQPTPEIIRRFLDRYDLSIVAFSKMTGIHRSTIQRYLNSKTQPPGVLFLAMLYIADELRKQERIISNHPAGD